MAHEHEYKEKNDETNEKLERIEIKILDDGSFLYTTHPKMKETGPSEPMMSRMKEYATDSMEKVLDWIQDDIGSAHQKKEGARHASFRETQEAIMRSPGFKPRYKGQSKEEAAGAVTAAMKDRLYGKSWRKEGK